MMRYFVIGLVGWIGTALLWGGIVALLGALAERRQARIAAARGLILASLREQLDGARGRPVGGIAATTFRPSGGPGLTLAQLMRTVDELREHPAGRIPTYEIVTIGAGALGIRCLVCYSVSTDPRDVAEHFCGYCFRFHDQEPGPWRPTRRPAPS